MSCVFKLNVMNIYVFNCKINKDEIKRLFMNNVSKKINFLNQKNPYFSPKRVKNIDIKIFKKLIILGSDIKKITY